jgi:hypothetical protein
MPRRPVRANAAALVFALLVLATVAAFAWAQRLKRDPLVLDRVTIATVATPGHQCRVRVRFRVTRSDDATVQVIKPGGRAVTTLVREGYLKRYHFFTFYWDGRRSDGGGFAAPGRYKVRVKLIGQERLLVPPQTIRLRRAVERGTRDCRHVKPHPAKGTSS